MVSPFGEGEFDPARDTAIHPLVLYPMIRYNSSRLVSHCPAKDTAFSITYIDDPVVPTISHEHDTLVLRHKQINTLPSDQQQGLTSGQGALCSSNKLCL